MNDILAPSRQPPALLIVGVGNGGCNTLQTMALQWPDAPRLVGINTDLRALAQLKAIERIHIGEKVLKGLGTGGDPRIARQAAESDMETLQPLFKGAELVIFAAGLGGGTGSGVTPMLIEEAKKAGALTLCFAMLPFEFEGARRQEQAACGLQAIRDSAAAVVCLPNQRLLALVEDKANIQEAFRRAETMLATGIREFWRVLQQSTLINFNFADLRAFLQNSGGNCIFCCAEGSGEQRIAAALDGIKKHILFNDGHALADANAFIVCIIGGTALSIGDVDRIVKGILAFGRKDALVMTGVGTEPEWNDRVHITVLAAEKGPSAGQIRHEVKPGMKAPSEAKQAEMVQTGLFDALEQGRFKGVTPTIVDGSNLDAPTFMRRRIQVQKAKITNI